MKTHGADNLYKDTVERLAENKALETHIPAIDSREALVANNNILLRADNTCSVFGPLATRVFLRQRTRLTELHQSAVDQAYVDSQLRQVPSPNRFFCLHEDGHVVAAGKEREHAVSYMTEKSVLVERQMPSAWLQDAVEFLKPQLPGITFGYLGNVESWGDDREWYIFLPHPGRVGKYGDGVSLGHTNHGYIAVGQWAGLEAQAREFYHNGSVRVELEKQFVIYTLHRGGRKQSVDYFEHHVHVKDCKCPAPNQDTPQTVAATSVQEALDKINTTLFCGSTTSQYVAPCVEGGAR